MDWETEHNLKKESFVKASLEALSKHELNAFNSLKTKFWAIKRRVRELKKEVADLEKQRGLLKKSKKKFNYFAIALMAVLLIISFFKNHSNEESWLVIILAALVYAWNAFSFHEEDKTLFQLIQTKDQTIELISMPLIELGFSNVAAENDIWLRLSEQGTSPNLLSRSDKLLWSTYQIDLDVTILRSIGVDVPFTF
jgi:hypothetical protein